MLYLESERSQLQQKQEQLALKLEQHQEGTRLYEEELVQCRSKLATLTRKLRYCNGGDMPNLEVAEVLFCRKSRAWVRIHRA